MIFQHVGNLKASLTCSWPGTSPRHGEMTVLVKNKSWVCVLNQTEMLCGQGYVSTKVTCKFCANERSAVMRNKPTVFSIGDFQWHCLQGTVLQQNSHTNPLH